MKNFSLQTLSSEIKDAIEKAVEIRKNAYAPYSNYYVGAVILTKDGKQFCGSNAETANYDGTCAETGAISEYIASGAKKVGDKIDFVVVIGGATNRSPIEESFATPCGRCRQRLHEHCSPNTKIICYNETVTSAKVFTLEELIPHAFGPENL